MRRPGKAGESQAGTHPGGTDGQYKWVALANTTAAVFMSALDRLDAPLHTESHAATRA
jgi:hypothetical protein